jgi:copper chaperone CopZ
MTTIDLHADGISCAHCKANIEGDLASEPGVRSVVAEVASKHILIDFGDEATDAGVLGAKLAEIGYPTS